MSRFVLVFSLFITFIFVILPISSKADDHPMEAITFHSLPSHLVAKTKYINLDDCTDAIGNLDVLNGSWSTDQVTTCPAGYVATENVKTGITKANATHLKCCKAVLEWA